MFEHKAIKMKVLFDNQIFSLQRYGGISRYFVEIMKRMPQDVDVISPTLLTDNVFLKTERFEGNKSVSLPDFKWKKKLYAAVNNSNFSRLLKRGDYDIFHPTYFDPGFLKRLHGPYVVTVHDMTYERFPELFGTEDPVISQKKETITRADKIIAISEKTKADIIDIYGLSGSNIEVIYHGHSLHPENAEAVEGLPEKYILYVGQRFHYKNFDRFLEAFAMVHKWNPEIKLVCTGGGFSRDEMSRIKMLGLEGAVSSRFVSDNQLAYLYQHALCFVFPSLYEGFGIPVLEAFASGCPVLLSNASCFPEVGGDAALFFDPYNPEEMAKTIESVVSDSNLRTQMIQRGHERVKAFSWDKTAAQTAEFYKK